MQRVALITGGARGIGSAIAQHMAHDHRIALTWLTTQPGNLPSDFLTMQADLTEDGATHRVIAAVVARFGRLDVIVNNAGVAVSTPLDRFSVLQATNMLQVNLLAAQSLLGAALPHLQPGAAVVNLSSVNAASSPPGAVLYGASKAALEHWTRGAAKELGRRQIRVNAVAPGAVDLPESPRSEESVASFAADTALGRIATPDDIARAVRFLASDDASFITGEVLTVSGGYRL